MPERKARSRMSVGVRPVAAEILSRILFFFPEDGASAREQSRSAWCKLCNTIVFIIYPSNVQICFDPAGEYFNVVHRTLLSETGACLRFAPPPRARQRPLLRAVFSWGASDNQYVVSPNMKWKVVPVIVFCNVMVVFCNSFRCCSVGKI